MKVNVGREINLQELLEKIMQFLKDSGLPPSKAILTVEYPEMWQVEGPDVVLKEGPLD